jgi:hypothetical protein
MEEVKFVSLFEFLGHSAGGTLGKEVYAKAKELNKPVKQRDVTNSKFTGKVMTYEYSFLTEYFNGVKADNNLPLFESKDSDEFPF